MTAGTAQDGYAAFAARLQHGGILADPYLAGEPRFREQPVVLAPGTARSLFAAAESLAHAYHELAVIVRDEPALLDSFFGLTPCQKMMWLSSAPRWHGIARADVFLTSEGPKICELNSDTPSGEAEAVLLGRGAVAAGDRRADPNAELLDRFVAMIEAFGAQVRPGQGSLVTGIVYPTEMPEDLSMIEIYRRALVARGHEVVLGSPFNLARHDDRRVALFGRPIDVLFRHYKTDWWGERLPVWKDAEPPSDSEPLIEPLAIAVEGVLSGTLAVVNPFGAVLTQNKRSLAFFHEELGRFSPAAAEAIRRTIPWTVRRETMEDAALLGERDRWVLKSAYGCEGDEVLIGRDTDPAAWRAAVELAVPGQWIIQERFDPLIDARGFQVNHGVYVVAGIAAGLYARVHRGATDDAALSAPVLIEGAIDE